MLWTTSAGELKAIADTLKDVLTECWFEFHDNRIVLLNVDVEKVVTVYMEIKPPPDDYTCPNTIYFATYIQLIYKVMRGSKASDMATLYSENGSSLDIQVKDANQNTKMMISLKGLNSKASKYTIPLQIADYQLDFNTSTMYYLLHDLGAISRTFDITINNNVVTFSANDEAGTILKFSDIRNTSTYSYKQTFLTKYVEKYLKPKLCKFVTLRFRQNAPLSVVFHLSHGFLEMTMAQLE